MVSADSEFTIVVNLMCCPGVVRHQINPPAPSSEGITFHQGLGEAIHAEGDDEHAKPFVDVPLHRAGPHGLVLHDRAAGQIADRRIHLGQRELQGGHSPRLEQVGRREAGDLRLWCSGNWGSSLAS